MIKQILLPLDGSHSALDFAVHLAKRTNAGIIAVTIVDEPEIMLPEPVPAGAGEFVEHKHKKLIEKSNEHNHNLIETFNKRCEKEGLKHSSIEKTGHPHEEILQIANELDIIIMPRISHFKSITQEEPCKTSEHVLQDTSRPMFLVPEKYHPGKEAYITYDGGKGASRTMQIAQMIGLLDDLKVTAIAIGKEEEKAKQYCHLIQSFMNHHDIPVTERPIITNEKPWNALLDSLKTPYPDFITMGAYEKSGLKEFFVGSFTKGMLEKSPVPIFIYH